MPIFRTRDMTWTVRDEHLVHNTSVLKIVAELAEAPEHAVLKNAGPRRLAVKRFTDDAGQVREAVWKEYQYPGRRAQLGQLVRASRARREWQILNALHDRRLPVPEPIAFGELRRAGVVRLQVVLMERLAQTTALHDLATDYRNGATCFRARAAKRRFIEQLGAFIGHAHQAGLQHADLHAGNILVHLGDLPRFYLIDLHRGKMRAQVSHAARIAGLAQFHVFFSTWASRADRLRFLAAYRQATPSADSLRAMTADVERATERSRRLLIQRRQQRCLEDNDEFATVPSHLGRGYYRRDCATSELFELFANPDAFFTDPQVEIVKDSRSTRIARGRFKLASGVDSIFVKRYNTRHWWDALKNLARPARALRAWRHGQALRLRQIATATPLAALEAGIERWRAASYLLTRDVEGGVGIDRYVEDHFGGERSAALLRRKRVFIERFAMFVRTLQDRGVYHFDLKSGNILVDDSGTGPPAFLFIDLDRLQFRKRLTRRQRRRNLVKINISFVDRQRISLTDRLRFLRAYLRNESDGRAERQAWWKSIEQTSAKKLRKSGRTFRSALRDR